MPSAWKLRCPSSCPRNSDHFAYFLTILCMCDRTYHSVIFIIGNANHSVEVVAVELEHKDWLFECLVVVLAESCEFLEMLVSRRHLFGVCLECSKVVFLALQYILNGLLLNLFKGLFNLLHQYLIRHDLTLCPSWLQGLSEVRSAVYLLGLLAFGLISANV